MKHAFFLCFVTLIIAGSVSAQEQTAQTLTDALRQTYLENPTLNAARRELRRTHEQLPQALSGWKPTVQVDFNASVSDIEGNAFGPTADGSNEKAVGISLSQPLFRGGITTAQTKAAKDVIAAQSAFLILTQQQVLRDSVRAYMDVLRDQSLLALSNKNRDVIAQQLQATKDRFDVGSVTKTDVKQAEARLAGANADIIRISGNLDTSRAVYKQIVGVFPQTLSNQNNVPALPETLDQAITTAQSNAPNLIAARHIHEAQKDNIDAVFGELLPQISLNASHSQTYDPNPGIPGVDQTDESIIGVYATIPLYQAGATRSRIREAMEEKMLRKIQVSEVERQVEQEVISSWKAYDTAKAEIIARKTQVDAARIAREGVYMEAEQGGRTVLDTLDADQELLNAEVDLVIAQRDEIVTAYNLAAALGSLTPESLGFGEVTINMNSHLQSVSGKIFSTDIDN